jgi:uncharacterized protein YjbI with pentapeptide repeats
LVEPETTPRERVRDLISLLVPDWRPTPKQVLWAIRIVIVLSLLVAIGFYYGITLWDWIKLLIVPAVIAGGGLWFNVQQREREQRIADNRAQDDSLQAYLDGMSDLLTKREQPLHGAQPGDSLSTVARARTLTVLGRLDGSRKRSVLQFLYESGLIYKEQTILNESDLIERRHNIVSLQQAALRGTDLSRANLFEADLSRADMREAYLFRAYLRGANLFEADLSKADMRWTILTEAYLRGAKMSGADLSLTNLTRAHLRWADLSEANLLTADLRWAILTEAYLSRAYLGGANMSGADLSRADMREASLYAALEWTEEQLSKASTLVGATMPDGQILQGEAVPDGPTFEEWLKSQVHKEDEENE